MRVIEIYLGKEKLHPPLVHCRSWIVSVSWPVTLLEKEKILSENLQVFGLLVLMKLEAL